MYDKYYMMITEDNKSSIWRSIYQGACEQAMAENVYVDWLGDDLFQGYSVEEQMQIAIASGVDGIIVTANENTEMTELVNKAAEENIPVVTLYGDNTQSACRSFVGIGSYNLGHEYGRLALQIIREKLAGQGVGLVSVQGNETIFEQVKVGKEGASRAGGRVGQCLCAGIGSVYSLLRYSGDH